MRGAPLAAVDAAIGWAAWGVTLSMSESAPLEHPDD